VGKGRLLSIIGICLLLAVFLGNTCVRGEFVTEPTDTIGEAGQMALKVGIEYLDGRQLEFTQGPKRDRKLTKLPYIGFEIGLGEMVDLEADFESIYLDEEGRDSKYGVGDLRLWNKIRFKDEEGYFPSMGFMWGVKLPNANYEDGFGTDETDFFSSFLFSKHIGNIYSHINLGLGILGNPDETNAQDDVLVYGVSVEYPMSGSINLLLDINGYAGSNNNNNFSSLILGFQKKMDDVIWDWGWKIGLTDESEDWGITTGIKWMLR